MRVLELTNVLAQSQNLVNSQCKRFGLLIVLTILSDQLYANLTLLIGFKVTRLEIRILYYLL